MSYSPTEHPNAAFKQLINESERILLKMVTSLQSISVVDATTLGTAIEDAKAALKSISVEEQE